MLLCRFTQLTKQNSIRVQMCHDGDAGWKNDDDDDDDYYVNDEDESMSD